MPGNNVVYGAFGGRVPESAGDAAPAEAPPSDDGSSGFEIDIAYCLSNLERVWEAHLRGDLMTNYLFDEVGYQKTDFSLELRRPIVRAYSFEQFCDYLLESVPAKWHAQPAFFGALFMEFHERQNFILAALEDRVDEVRALAPAHLELLMKIALRAET
jgi:hypothetical protein